MPSGAKKRKAARRKKEMGIHPPDSSTSSSSGNSESHDSKGETSDEGEEKKGESPRSESITAAVMDSLDNGKEKLSEGTAKVTENPPEEEKKKMVEEETVAKDVGAELVQTEEGEGAAGGVEPTEVVQEMTATVASVVDEPVVVTEEVIETTEAAVVTSEASLVIDTLLAHENEVKPAPIFDIPPAPVIEQTQPCESRARERSEVDHATWWNCCGLFHVLASSKDATRNQDAVCCCIRPYTCSSGRLSSHLQCELHVLQSSPSLMTTTAMTLSGEMLATTTAEGERYEGAREDIPLPHKEQEFLPLQQQSPSGATSDTC